MGGGGGGGVGKEGAGGVNKKSLNLQMCREKSSGGPSMGHFVIDEVNLQAANGAVDEFVRVKRRL